MVVVQLPVNPPFPSYFLHHVRGFLGGLYTLGVIPPPRVLENVDEVNVDEVNVDELMLMSMSMSVCLSSFCFPPT